MKYPLIIAESLAQQFFFCIFGEHDYTMCHKMFQTVFHKMTHTQYRNNDKNIGV